MIDLSRIDRQVLFTQPYQWALIDHLFTSSDAAALAADFPRDHYKRIKSYGSEKGQEYEARSLLQMGAKMPTHVESLGSVWRQFAEGLLSPGYRAAMSKLTGMDLSSLPVEVNVHHYGPGHWLGPHVDMKEKVLTHVLYFNQDWNEVDGGCLHVLRSSDMKDVEATVLPKVGNSAVIVRSDRSWHAVSHVIEGCRRSRRSMTVTFYQPGSVSPMWPPGETPLLHDYTDPEETAEDQESALQLSDPEAAARAIRERNAALVKRDWRILELETMIAERDRQIRDLESRLGAGPWQIAVRAKESPWLHRISSWRLTRVLRSLVRRLRRLIRFGRN